MSLSQCLFRLKPQRLRTLLSIRQISSSTKNQETVAIAKEAKKECQPIPEVNKNWITYGFDVKSESYDRTILHMTLFSGLTVSLVLVGYVIMYLPDINLKQWSQREAFIELRRREAAGLDPISPNLIDPQKIELPSDEDLCDVEILI